MVAMVMNTINRPPTYLVFVQTSASHKENGVLGCSESVVLVFEQSCGTNIGVSSHRGLTNTE